MFKVGDRVQIVNTNWDEWNGQTGIITGFHSSSFDDHLNVIELEDPFIDSILGKLITMHLKDDILELAPPRLPDWRI